MENTSCEICKQNPHHNLCPNNPINLDSVQYRASQTDFELHGDMAQEFNNTYPGEEDDCEPEDFNEPF